MRKRNFPPRSDAGRVAPEISNRQFTYSYNFLTPRAKIMQVVPLEGQINDLQNGANCIKIGPVVFELWVKEFNFYEIFVFKKFWKRHGRIFLFISWKRKDLWKSENNRWKGNKKFYKSIYLIKPRKMHRFGAIKENLVFSKTEFASLRHHRTKTWKDW